ncbi:hypothetical protein Csa_023722, partial [Cucumis sativus]
AWRRKAKGKGRGNCCQTQNYRFQFVGTSDYMMKM